MKKMHFNNYYDNMAYVTVIYRKYLGDFPLWVNGETLYRRHLIQSLTVPERERSLDIV